ncbi:MAG TPA: hypothetical protein VFN22_12450 [Gemmatimonadales bacterium]|nr:hypothetical protein [Gemmatimonadales bacterium]
MRAFAEDGGTGWLDCTLLTPEPVIPSQYRASGDVGDPTGVSWT